MTERTDWLNRRERAPALLIAELLSGEVARRTPPSFRDRLVSALGGDPDFVDFESRVAGLDDLVEWAGLGILFAQQPPTLLDGIRPGQRPVWGESLVPDLPVVPHGLLAGWENLEGLGGPVGLLVSPSRSFVDAFDLAWYVPRSVAKRFHVWRQHAVRGWEQAVGAALRGSVYRVTDATIEQLELPPIERADLEFDPEVWRVLDEDVLRLFANAEVLLDLGLGLDRGVLLHGPSGTGKTDLMRVVMHELRDQVTVLLPDNSVARGNLSGLYSLAAQLRPTLVVLDDIDLIIGSGRSSSTLVDFLSSVDGAVNSHEGIITLAATNRLQVIDEAARRSARFDRHIELPRPPAAGRARILTRYLGRFAGHVDVQRVAGATAGATGADLREVVRQAVLATNGTPDTAAVLAAVDAGAFVDAAAGRGSYL